MKMIVPLVLLAAALTGGVMGVVIYSAPKGEPIIDCRVVDGDTLRCGDERVRLLAIDAPETGGRCRPGRVCAPGDPVASTASLTRGLTGSLTIERVGRDRYDRTLALVSGDNGDLSCWQLKAGQAIYRSDWDDGGMVADRCGAAR